MTDPHPAGLSHVNEELDEMTIDLEKHGLRVKPLEWVSGWFCDQDAFYADTSTGNWAVVQYSSRNGRWAYDDPSGEASDDDWGSASLAQAAAQSDYEARILDTLEVTK